MAFDGSGRGWEACILQVSSSRVVASVKRTLSDPLLTPAVTLAVGSIKASRMDWAVEKAAELGAVRFIPLESRFSVVEPGVGKLRRWRSLALAAAKQSHRLRLMEIADPNTVAVALNDLPRPLLWCSIAEESEPIIECLRKLGSFSEASILIGPEGGWAEEEIAALRASQALPISLGTHPLRTESAVAVALGITLNAALQR
jgi:16S rRNA (uracil1498-N3)-methyltransferase